MRIYCTLPFTQTTVQIIRFPKVQFRLYCLTVAAGNRLIKKATEEPWKYTLAAINCSIDYDGLMNV